ncbi:MAG: hypothetical protein WCF65_05005 [Parachlamydiaceae bacterium]
MNFNQDSSTPIKFTPGRDGSYSSSSGEVGTRPAGDPKSGKDFKKILGKNKDPKESSDDDATKKIVEEGEGDDGIVADLDDTTSQKKPPMSLFDLTSGKLPIDNLKPKGERGLVKTGTAPSVPMVVKPKQKADDVVAEAVFAPSNDATPASMSSTSGKFTTRFATEQTDLSYINPMAAMSAAMSNQAIDPAVANVAKPIPPTTSIQDIINQLVGKVVEMKDNGKTETIITLKNPPLFAGANIVVTAFDSAKGEFNLTFENLSQSAKNMLDMRANQQSLMSALQQKGYAVHIVTTTTLMENRPVIADASQGGRPGDERGDERGRQQDGGRNPRGRQQG